MLRRAALPSHAADIQGLTWSKLSRGCMLGVRRGEGPALCFMGFRDKDLEPLRQLSAQAIKVRCTSAVCRAPCAVCGSYEG